MSAVDTQSSEEDEDEGEVQLRATLHTHSEDVPLEAVDNIGARHIPDLIADVVCGVHTSDVEMTLKGKESSKLGSCKQAYSYTYTIALSEHAISAESISTLYNLLVDANSVCVTNPNKSKSFSLKHIGHVELGILGR